MCSFPPCLTCRREWADHDNDQCPRYRRRWTAADWWFTAGLAVTAVWRHLIRRP